MTLPASRVQDEEEEEGDGQGTEDAQRSSGHKAGAFTTPSVCKLS